MKFIITLVFLFSTMVSDICHGCENSPKKGLLWEISGNGLTEKSYLFGTWHGSTGVCVDFLDSIPHFYKIFDSVSQYVGENVGDKDVSEAMASIKDYLGELWMPQNTKYSDLLNQTDVLFLDSLLQKYIGAASSEINIRPNHLLFTLSSILSQKCYLESDDKNCKVVMDNYLAHEAKEKSYSLVGLDSPETTKRLLMEFYLDGYKPGMTLQEDAHFLIC